MELGSPTADRLRVEELGLQRSALSLEAVHAIKNHVHDSNCGIN